MESRVPLQNLFYLLCYASNHLQARRLIDVSAITGTAPMALYAVILDACVARLRRRGVPRQYRAFREDTGTPRGRIALTPSIARGLVQRRMLTCEIDALTADIPFNQLVKAALRRLAGNAHVDRARRARLRGHLRFLGHIADIPPSARALEAARAGRLDGGNDFLLGICELVLADLLLEPTGAGAADRGLRFDEYDGTSQKMGLLFESFVRNFLAREQSRYRVRKRRIPWQVDAHDRAVRMLPMMEGDMLLIRPDRRILIECKYLSRPVRARQGGRDKLISSNLYQLHTYLAHLSADGGPPTVGVLLYAEVDGPLSLDYRLLDYSLLVRTLDLSQPWQGIHDDLLALVQGPASSQLDFASNAGVER